MGAIEEAKVSEGCKTGNSGIRLCHAREAQHYLYLLFINVNPPNSVLAVDHVLEKRKALSMSIQELAANSTWFQTICKENDPIIFPGLRVNLFCTAAPHVVGN